MTFPWGAKTRPSAFCKGFSAFPAAGGRIRVEALLGEPLLAAYM